MEQKPVSIQARRAFLSAMIPAAAFAVSSCSQLRSKTAGAMTFRMGERASVGKLIYNVLETQWKTTLGDGPSARIPENRFLLLRITVANSGQAAVNIPLLSVFDANGKQYREIDNGENVDSWLGLLRSVGTAASLSGSILFDLPPASYKLQITDGGDIENEMIAFVDIPLQLEADPVLSEPPALKK